MYAQVLGWLYPAITIPFNGKAPSFTEKNDTRTIPNQKAGIAYINNANPNDATSIFLPLKAAETVPSRVPNPIANICAIKARDKVAINLFPNISITGFLYLKDIPKSRLTSCLKYLRYCIGKG